MKPGPSAKRVDDESAYLSYLHESWQIESMLLALLTDMNQPGKGKLVVANPKYTPNDRMSNHEKLLHYLPPNGAKC
jgi:hypothetical protein